MSREPELTTEQALPDPPTVAGRSGRPSALPEWMINPPPPRVTLTGRVVGALLRVPGVARLRQGWWAWQGRRRWHQRFPNTFKIVAFFASWGLALALLLGAYALFSLI